MEKSGSQSKLEIHMANKHSPEHWAKKKKLSFRGWGFSCVVEHKAVGSVPSSGKK